METKILLENYAGGDISFTTPTIVRELLSSSEIDVTKISVAFECDQNSGWIWLIYARTVYAWNFKDQNLQCYELPLPSSELIYHARLCLVYPRSDDTTRLPRCVSVSPEGSVRYWPSINQPNVYVDFNVELSGQGKQSYPTVVLTTTTCNSFLISISGEFLKREQQVLQCTPLKAPQNLISGIGRRVSAMIFATAFSSALQDALVNVGTVVKRESRHTNLLYVLNTKFQMQCWELELEKSNRLLWESDIRRFVRNAVAEILNSRTGDVHAHDNIEVWPLDFLITARRRFGILVAVADPNSSSNVHYAVVLFKETEEPPSEILGVYRLPIIRNYEPQLKEIDNNDLTLLCPFSYDGIFVNNESTLAISQEAEQKILSICVPESDRILGAGVHGDQFMIFTSEQGVRTVDVSLGRFASSRISDVTGRRLMPSEISSADEELDEMAQDEDRFIKFKAAFLYFMKQKLPECENILQELFTYDTGDLDDLVIRMVIDFSDHYPTSDPRWQHAVDQAKVQDSIVTRRKAKSRKVEMDSLLLLSQLDGKRKTMQRFLAFLRSTKLYEQLATCHATYGSAVPTIVELCGLGERLESCAAFARKVDENLDTLDVVLRAVMSLIVKKRGESTSGILSVKDLFYRKVSLFHELLPVLVDEGLLEVERSVKDNSKEPDYAQKLFGLIGDLLMVIMATAWEYRRIFERIMHCRMPNMRTWLNEEPSRRALEKYSRRMIEALPTSGKASLMKRCRDMADCILKECSIAPDRRLYEAELRRRLILPLAEHGRLDDARNLAETYHDFNLMVELCCEYGNEHVLETYKIEYGDSGFLDTLYDYYIKKGTPGKIVQDTNLECDEYAKSTDRYLSSRECYDLKWSLNAKMNEFAKASRDLLTLANNERRSIDKKKTLLSLAKLAALASDDEESCLKESEKGLIVVEHQKQLPSIADGPPIQVEEIIQAFISDPYADETYFARAANLLAIVRRNDMPKNDYSELRTRIWSKAILRDNWKTILDTTDDPLVAASETIFFRTILLLCQSYNDKQKLMDQFAAATELLQSLELRDLVGNAKFEYILRAGEEQIHGWVKEQGREWAKKFSDSDIQSITIDEKMQ